MPKNKIGGSKHKKSKNYVQNTSLRLKQENEEYGKILLVLGNCRFKILCSDGIERTGILRGNMKKKKFVNKDDIVLIERWDELQNGKCSIIDVYKDDNIKKLIKMKELPSIFEDNEDDGTDDFFSEHLSDNSDEEEIFEEEEEKDEIDLDEI